ncbi:MAG: hypothetical protein GXY55_14890 [Phycisphaerae bacterium]|nr:hypothetical protein [Phycisphaerae bacterium]
MGYQVVSDNGGYMVGVADYEEYYDAALELSVRSILEGESSCRRYLRIVSDDPNEDMYDLQQTETPALDNVYEAVMAQACCQAHGYYIFYRWDWCPSPRTEVENLISGASITPVSVTRHADDDDLTNYTLEDGSKLVVNQKDRTILDMEHADKCG